MVLNNVDKDRQMHNLELVDPNNEAYPIVHLYKKVPKWEDDKKGILNSRGKQFPCFPQLSLLKYGFKIFIVCQQKDMKTTFLKPPSQGPIHINQTIRKISIVNVIIFDPCYVKRNILGWRNIVLGFDLVRHRTMFLFKGRERIKDI